MTGPKTHCVRGHDLALVGRDTNRRCRACVREGPRAHTGNARHRSPEVEEQIREAWEETPESAPQIAARFDMTKNAIIGLARRRQWISYNVCGTSPQAGSYRTMNQRLDALTAAMNAVIAETPPALDARTKIGARP